MPTDQRKYVRVYYSIRTDPKFAGIYDDDRLLAGWLRLLLDADAAYPSPASIPRSAARAIRPLVDAGLIDTVPGDLFVVHGLASERGMRSHHGRIGAAVRWHSGEDATGLLAEQSIDKQSSTPLTPLRGGRRANGTNGRAVAAERDRQRRLDIAAVRRQYPSKITEAEMDAQVAAIRSRP